MNSHIPWTAKWSEHRGAQEGYRKSVKFQTASGLFPRQYAALGIKPFTRAIQPCHSLTQKQKRGMFGGAANSRSTGTGSKKEGAWNKRTLSLNIDTCKNCLVSLRKGKIYGFL